MRGNRILAFLMMLGALVLSACGSGYGPGGTPPKCTGSSCTSPTYFVGYIDTSTNKFVSKQILITAASQPLPAGGTASLHLDIVDQTGALAPVSATAVFTSTCIASQLAAVNPSSTITSSTGTIDATYVAQGCSGTDPISAQVTISSANFVATAVGSVQVQAAAVGDIQFESLSNEVIGMIGSPISGQTTVKFKVVDASGGKVIGAPVTFTLSTTAGGIALTPPAGTAVNTDSNGEVQTILTAGSAHTSVTVTASTPDSSGGTLIRQSAPIAVTTGLPTFDGVSVSATKLAIFGACDGDSTKINVRLADRYSNPVPINTQPVLTTNGGKINGQCLTGDPLGDPLTEAGVCSVTYVVQNPRPPQGQAAVLAYVTGEESFTDVGGGGYYQAGDAFTDISSPYLDVNFNGVFDAGTDLPEGGPYVAPSGTFKGYVCDSPGVNCRTTTTQVGNFGLGINQITGLRTKPNVMMIVFSYPDPNNTLIIGPTITVPTGSTGVTTDGSTTIDFTGSGSATISLKVEDVNGNPYPSGTTFTMSSTVGTFIGGGTWGPINENVPAQMNFIVQGGTPAGKSSQVTLTANVPASACSGPLTLTWSPGITITD